MTDALLEVLGEGRELGFLGPGPVEPHLAHAIAFGRVVRRAYGGGDSGCVAVGRGANGPASSLGMQPDAVGPARLLDLGSGGGLPGLVLAVGWSRATVVLLDAQHRRTAFLAEAAQRLGVTTRVEVLEGRAEVCGRDAGLRGCFDTVVARAFGRPAVTAECAAPFLRPGGLLVVSEPPGRAVAPIAPSAEGRWPREGLVQLGMGPATPVHDEFGFVVVRQVSACPERFPRRVGVPAKRPLF